MMHGHHYNDYYILEEGAYLRCRQDGTLLNDGLAWSEDLRQSWNRFATESTAAPFLAPISSESLLSGSHQPLYVTKGVLVNPSVQWHYPMTINHTSVPSHYQLNHSSSIVPRDLTSVTLLKILALPSHYPLHVDSILAELFSRQLSYYRFNPIDMLETFRQTTVSRYGDYVQEAPTMFSYAKAANLHFQVPIQFGVSAPRAECSTTLAVGMMVRDYRVLQCWGEQKPPAKQEVWRHGHCAESQSLPSVVAWCERLGLENVVVETLAVNKAGKFFDILHGVFLTSILGMSSL